MAYIDKEKVLEICEEHYQHCIEMHDYCGDTTADNIKEDIEKLPTADVVEVVRCKECQHACFQYNSDKYPFGVYACKKQPTGRAYKKVRGDFWCAYGKRTPQKEG